MTPELSEWVAKAEADFATTRRELPHTDPPNYEGVCFHAQQCVEKYLKAYLFSKAVRFPKTHNLVTLLDLALAFQPLWEAWRLSLRTLNGYAVEFRYPGENAEREDAEDAFKIVKAFRSAARTELGL